MRYGLKMENRIRHEDMTAGSIMHEKEIGSHNTKAPKTRHVKTNLANTDFKDTTFFSSEKDCDPKRVWRGFLKKYDKW